MHNAFLVYSSFAYYVWVQIAIRHALHNIYKAAFQAGFRPVVNLVYGCMYVCGPARPMSWPAAPDARMRPVGARGRAPPAPSHRAQTRAESG